MQNCANAGKTIPDASKVIPDAGKILYMWAKLDASKIISNANNVSNVISDASKNKWPISDLNLDLVYSL